MLSSVVMERKSGFLPEVYNAVQRPPSQKSFSEDCDRVFWSLYVSISFRETFTTVQLNKQERQ